MITTIFFHPGNNYTGSTRVLLDVIEEDYKNEEVTVITKDISNDGFLSNKENIKIIKVFFKRTNIKLFQKIISVISNIHFFYLAIFCGYHFKTFYINTIIPSSAAIAGCLLRKNITYHVHEKFVNRSFRVKIKEFVLNNIKSNKIFVSEYTKNQYKNSKGEIFIRYNRLSESFVKNIKETEPVNENPRNIIMICSLIKGKGIDIFIKVANEMAHFSFCLVISANMPQISSFIKEEIPTNLKIIDYKANIHPYLAKSDLLLNLSNPNLCIETFGMTIIEGLAYGLPAIVPNIGGPTEIIIDNYNGFTVDTTNVAEIQYSIETILDSKNYKLFSKNALQSAKKYYPIAVINL